MFVTCFPRLNFVAHFGHFAYHHRRRHRQHRYSLDYVPATTSCSTTTITRTHSYHDLTNSNANSIKTCPSSLSGTTTTSTVTIAAVHQNLPWNSITWIAQAISWMAHQKYDHHTLAEAWVTQLEFWCKFLKPPNTRLLLSYLPHCVHTYIHMYVYMYKRTVTHPVDGFNRLRDTIKIQIEITFRV